MRWPRAARAAMAEAMRRTWADPTRRALMTEAIILGWRRRRTRATLARLAAQAAPLEAGGMDRTLVGSGGVDHAEPKAAGGYQ